MRQIRDQRREYALSMTDALRNACFNVMEQQKKQILPVTNIFFPVFQQYIAEYDCIGKESKTVKESAYAEAISYNKKNLEREGRKNQSKKTSRKIRFPKGTVRCIIKITKEGDNFEYNGADTSKGFGAPAITPLYGR